jgi:hypothetical protein
MNHLDRLREFESKHGSWHDNLSAYSRAACKDYQTNDDKKAAEEARANMHRIDLLIAEWQGYNRGYKAAKLEVLL